MGNKSNFTLAGVNTNLGETVPGTTGINLLESSKSAFSIIVPGGPEIPTSQFDSGDANYKIQKYNQQEHIIELYLDNSGTFDSPNQFHINPAAVLGLHISDTVNDWVVDGSLTFMYLPDGITSSQKSKTGQGKQTMTGVEKAAKQNAKVLENYQFRGDGFDLLRVMIMPKSASGGDGKGATIDKSDTKWLLSYIFSIFDVEDVNDIPQLQGHAAAYMKCLKLKFHDVRYQMLQTTNLEYSTAVPKDPSLQPNFSSGLANEGVLHTGDAMRDILNEALSKPDKGGSLEFQITNSNDEWDKGAGELFYTSPAQSSALDDLEYLYAHHVSASKTLEGVENTNDLCLLHTERPKSFGLIEPLVLTPLTNFFEKAGKEANSPGELQKEHFFVTSHTEEVEDAEKLHRAPMGGNGKDIDFKTFKYGQIISYSFVDMSPTVNSNMFCSTPVYSVDIGKRQFNIEFKGNDVKSARTAISKSYISKLYKEGSNEEKLFLPIIHKNKKDLNIFPTFSLNGDNKLARQKNGILNLIYTGLFQNACICFKVYGLTLRESGTFIGIDKTAGCADNDHNNKLYGQWFVVKVDHIFEAGAYMNIIYAVKLHRHKEMEMQFGSTLE